MARFNGTTGMHKGWQQQPQQPVRPETKRNHGDNIAVEEPTN